MLVRQSSGEWKYRRLEDKTEAIVLHRQLWDRISKLCKERDCVCLDDYEVECEVDDLKDDVLMEMGYDKVSYNCFLCEYALTVATDNSEPRNERCKYCPVIWNNKQADEARIKKGYYCCTDDDCSYAFSDPGCVRDKEVKQDD